VGDNDGLVGNTVNNLYGLIPSQLNLPTNLRDRNGDVVFMNDMFNLTTPIASMGVRNDKNLSVGDLRPHGK
jgi:hypothetical protein